jgi:hypothetical protein
MKNKKVIVIKKNITNVNKKKKKIEERKRQLNEYG